MSCVHVVAHEATGGALIAGRQVPLFAGHQRALFSVEARVARGACGTFGFLAVLGDQRVDAGGLGVLTLGRGAAFFAAGRR